MDQTTQQVSAQEAEQVPQLQAAESSQRNWYDLLGLNPYEETPLELYAG